MLEKIWKMKPSFFILGAQKAGTTKLFYLLKKHSNIICPKENPTNYFSKELHFFDQPEIGRKKDYLKSFPAKYEQKIKNIKVKGNIITGEATPDYLKHTHRAEIVKQWFPDLKLIILLRNPIDRAYSSHQHAKRIGKGYDTFEDAIKYGYKPGKWGDYLEKGLYASQIKAWLKYFPAKQMLILKNDDLKNNQDELILKVCNFLNIPYKKIDDIDRNVGDYKEKMNPETRKKLIEYYRPHNAELEEFLGEKLDWDK